jgi:hypothetical protein
MFGWLKKDIECAGSVLFRGNLSPRMEEFGFLEKQGITISPGPAKGAQWSLSLSHPKWGTAHLICLKDMSPPDEMTIEYSVGMTPEEKEIARSAGNVLQVVCPAERKHILRDRKRFLWYLGTIMGDDGVGAMDHLSMQLWSRNSLDDELMHDADVDVNALFTIHAVTEDGESCSWLHTHGLAEVGAMDYDMIRPSQSAAHSDLSRALAFNLLEGSIKPGDLYQAMYPDGEVRLVDCKTFMSSGPASETGVREDDDHHNGKRVVLCEPGGGMLGRFRKGVRASKFLQKELPDRAIVPYTQSATELMALRARATIGVFAGAIAELKEFEFPAAVKMGYPTDSGGEMNREHLWFEVHDVGQDSIDATLMNEPFDIESMTQGQRGRHPIERLTEWQMMTPVGPITPQSLRGLRAIRENKDEFRRIMREYPDA